MGRSVVFSVVTKVLPLMNSLCNPLIYACLDQIYKEAFKRLFQRMFAEQAQSGNYHLMQCDKLRVSILVMRVYYVGFASRHAHVTALWRTM